LSSEEWQRREGEPSREDMSREELREESEKAEGVPEAVEMEGIENFDVVSETDAGEPVEDPTGEPLTEAPLDRETSLDEAPSEEPLEITQDKISALADELELVREERDEYLESMRRMKAELENSRKRQEKERARLVQLASERLVRELLPVLDNLERALEVEGNIREGVRATREQLLTALEREGLTPVASDGESFDPTVHEAVMGQPSDEHEEDTVIMTLERGYVLNGKPIRPAKVVVAK
jgi:molecular chaperone GrpE